MILGREHEKQAVVEALASARDGRAASLLLVGLPGIGKTTLLDQAETNAADVGMSTVRVTAVESESGIPGSGLSLLRPLLGEGNLSDPWTLLRSISDLAQETPWLIVLDDVHWLDAESLAALDFVVRRLADDSVTLLMAARPEIDDPLRLPNVPRLAVEPLADDDAASLLMSVSPSTPRAVAAQLADALGNVPLALVEAPSLLSADVLGGRTALPMPVPVGRSVSARYARGVDALPGGVRWGLVLASADDSGDPTVLASALERADLSRHDLEPAVEGGLLLPGPGVRFRHPLVRAAVHASATEEERRRAHVLLAAVHADAGDEELELRHAAAAAIGADEVLAARLEAAVPGVVGRRGNAAAAVLAMSAANLSRRPADRWRRLVSAVELQRRSPSAGVAAREVVERCSDGDLRARAAIVLADEHLPPGEDAALLGDAAQWATSDAVWEDVQDYRVILAISRSDTKTLAVLRRELDDRRSTRGVTWVSEYTLGLTLLELGEPREGLALARSALEHSEGKAPGPDRSMFMWEWVRIPVMAEEHGWRSALVVERLRLAALVLRAVRDPVNTAIADLLEVQRYLATGELSRADSLALAVASLGPEIGGLELGARRYLIEVAARQGRVTDTHRRAQEYTEATGEVAGSFRALSGLVHILEGDAHAALDVLREVPPRESCNPERAEIWLRALEVEALVLLGRRDEAAELADRYDDLVDGLPSPRLRSLGLRNRALIEPDPAIGPWDEAIELARAGEDTWELARTLLLLGERLRRSRRLSAARGPLKEAAALFRRSRADAWAARAESELAAAGEAPAPVTRAELDLTPQELRIALAVADGLSNNEIASTVFLSAKTVETHLTRVYRKLGVRSRGGVAKALVEAGVSGGAS